MNTATELLRRALDALHFDLSAKESAKVAEEIRAFLAAEPEAEPVGYAVKMIPRGLHFIGFVSEIETDEEIEEYGPDQIVPLYTRPEPARKPMTEEEIRKEANFIDPYLSARAAFKFGVRWAERKHEIGGDDE